MATMLVTEDTPTKLVLTKELSKPQSNLSDRISNVVLATIFLIAITGLAELTNSTTSLRFLTIALGSTLVEAILIVRLVLFIIRDRKSVKKVTVTIDVERECATRIEMLKSGEIKQSEVKFEEVTHILIHSEWLMHGVHGLTITLESQHNLPFDVNSDWPAGSLPTSQGQLLDLGKKLGNLIKKPVVFRETSGGEPVSEESIQG